jgi:hypothetical protein
MQETCQWEDPPGTDIQAYDPEAAAAQLGLAPEVNYYALLEVGRDADGATIKRQYYILARKWHPGEPQREGLCFGIFKAGGRGAGLCSVGWEMCAA